MFKICFEKGLSFEKERYLNFLSNNIIPVILDEEGVVCSRASEYLKTIEVEVLRPQNIFLKFLHMVKMSEING